MDETIIKWCPAVRPDGKIHHATIIRDKDGNEKWYIDGEEVNYGQETK